MKNTLLSIILIAISALNLTAAKKLTVDTIEPPYWWCGFTDPTLQIMLHGNDLSSCNVTLLPYEGVTLDSIVSLDSPNYLLLYLNISQQTRPGTLTFEFAASKNKKTELKYQLRKRENHASGRAGFDATDVLYLLMPDRFANGDTLNDNSLEKLKNPVTTNRNNPSGRHGGDIKGIIDHLDYIDSLGVTAIWSCPVLENDMPGGSYHGYATTNYYRIDPRFGTNDEWSELVKLAHNRNIKVVMDMIFNHTGVCHPWMLDTPSNDWYNNPDGNCMTNFRLSTLHDPYASHFDKNATTEGWFVPAMPDLNQRNTHLLKYLIQNSIWWIESSAIDGIRMDTYPYADSKAMGQWITAIEHEYPDFSIVGECWYGDTGAESYWQHNSRTNPVDPVLKTVMDFVPTTRLRPAFEEETTPWSGLSKVYDHLSLDFLFPDPQRVLVFLDNHDTDRWLLEEPTKLDKWKQAITWLLTSRGIPQIYYGTEILMNGTKSRTDGDIRLDMPGGFPSDTISVFTNNGRNELQNKAYAFMSRLLKWRKGTAGDVIAHGKLKHFLPINGLYVYSHKLNDKEIVVIMNGTDNTNSANMTNLSETLPAESKWHNVIDDTEITISETMNFEPRQIMILQDK